MRSWTRRHFLAGSGVAAGAFASWPMLGLTPAAARAAVAMAGEGAPDLVVKNAKVYTVDAAQPQAEAFAVKNGYFAAVGSSEQIASLAGPKTKVIDAEGMTVTPGFIDAHTHPASAGVSELRKVNCDLRKIADIQQAMRRRAQETPPGRWVQGFKYDDTKLKDGRPLSRKDLDQAVPDHPAEVLHRGGHTAIYNSMAFRQAGVTKDTPDPTGGSFGRDANGDLTGFVAELARDVFNSVAPAPPITRADQQAGVKKVAEIMTASGLTSVHDAHTTAEFFTAYQDAQAAGELLFRVYCMVGPELFESLKAASIRTGFGDEHVRVGGLKLFADGSCSERTMRMSTPYEGRPDYYGILTMSQEELNETIEDAFAHQFQVGVHANGDVAIAMVLTAYERALKKLSLRDVRPRIEHCTLINNDLLRRIKSVGAIPTPFYTYVHYHGDKWANYGQERLQWMFAHRSFLDHAIPVASASDYVPGPFEPLMAIQSMVTRKDFEGRVWGPKQKISVDQALRVCTMNAARASFEEDIKGSITPGKLADFVVLADDPHTFDPDRIKEIEVVETVVGGKTVYHR